MTSTRILALLAAAGVLSLVQLASSNTTQAGGRVVKQNQLLSGQQQMSPSGAGMDTSNQMMQTMNQMNGHLQGGVPGMFGQTFGQQQQGGMFGGQSHWPAQQHNNHFGSPPPLAQFWNPMQQAFHNQQMPWNQLMNPFNQMNGQQQQHPNGNMFPNMNQMNANQMRPQQMPNGHSMFNQQQFPVDGQMHIMPFNGMQNGQMNPSNGMPFHLNGLNGMNGMGGQNNMQQPIRTNRM